MQTEYGGVNVLVSSMHDESLFSERVLRAGARGYISKDEASEKVIDAIRQVLDGEVYLSDQIMQKLARTMVGGRAGDGQSTLESLSDRELEVFDLIGRGLTTRDIADRLHLSVKTIESYREHIKSKLTIESSAQLMRHAVQWVLENG